MQPDDQTRVAAFHHVYIGWTGGIFREEYTATCTCGWTVSRKNEVDVKAAAHAHLGPGARMVTK